MQSIVMTEAAARSPSAIVQPRSTDEVAAAVAAVHDAGAELTVRGGSHSPRCAVDGAVMLDLSEHLAAAEPVDDGERVMVGGGVTMGAVVAALAPLDRVVPIGASPTPGVGLALQGGFGGLARPHGLTLDHLEAVELVLADGEIVEIDGTSTGEHADLWWAVRGAGPHVGVVTRAWFRTIDLASVLVVRRVVGLDALAGLLAFATEAPRHRSCTFTLDHDDDGRPAMLAMWTWSGPIDADGHIVADIDAALADTGTTVHTSIDERLPYAQHPPLAIPGVDGVLSDEPPGSPPQERAVPYNTSALLPADVDPLVVADAITAAVRSAPTAACRVDAQQAGGAVGDVAPDATAFVHRDVGWNVSIEASWPWGDAGAASCRRWAEAAEAALRPDAIGDYAVDIRADRPGVTRQVRRAYGDNLEHLRSITERVDPDGVFTAAFHL
jgi:FAD/FMN-containing dehydrogenase